MNETLNTEANVEHARMQNEKQYFRRLKEGGRVKKNAAQLDSLIMHF